MEERQLIKEIITTETEKYSDEGKIREKVRETREKIYNHGKVASVVEHHAPVTLPIQKEEVKEELVKQAAEAIDNKAPQEVVAPEPVKTEPVVNNYTPTQTPAPIPVPQYNVINRTPQTPPAAEPTPQTNPLPSPSSIPVTVPTMPTIQKPKLPWEK